MAQEEKETNINQLNPYSYPFPAPHTPFSLEGQWQPWYDDRRDYNTNAPTYYDYLSNFNKIITDIVELLNRVARRNISVEDTNCVDLTKINDWVDEGNPCQTYHDVITLKADVILSTYQKAIAFDGKDYKLSNAITCLNTGLYASDYLPLLNSLKDKLNQEIQDRINGDNKLKQYIDNKVTEINQTINNITNNFKDLEKKLNQEIQDRKHADDDLRGLIQATIQPDLSTIDFDIVDNKLIDANTQPPNKRHGLDYGSVYVQSLNKTYEYFKIGIAGWDFNFNNPNNNEVRILKAPLSRLRAAGVSESMIYQAQKLNWTIIEGYYQSVSNNLTNTQFRISGDNKYLYINAYFDPKGALIESNSNHVIMNIVQN